MRSHAFLLLPLLFILPSRAAAPETVRYQVTGLFMKEREAGLQALVAKITDTKFVRVDFENGDCYFEYDAAVAFAKVKPDQIGQRLDSLVKSASSNTFGIKPVRTVPRDQLKLIEIPVAGLDCKACSLAAYEAVFRLEGVEQAMASFREGRVT